jgi:signal transduction histidine kinase
LISIEQRHEIQRLKESGEIAKASQFLKDLVYNKELTLESTEDLSELCLLYIKQSRYQEAYEQGLLIQRLVNIRQQSSLRVLVAALTFAIFSFVDVSWVQKLGRMLSLNLISYKGIRKVNYKTFDGILWGVYWQDMKQALKMNVLCAVTATSETDRVKGYAFLYYTLAFHGFTWIGLHGLRRLIRYCEINQRQDLESDLLTWVGVAYQMSRYPKQCLATHKTLADRFPKAEPFYQIISYASQLNMAAAELGPREVRVALAKCFAVSFALKESRNHIQIYGAKAELLGLEGRREEAISFLERAHFAKVRNSNTLDTAIYNRFAAVTFLNLGEPNAAMEHIHQVSAAMKNYAPLMWYRQEIARLEAIAKYQMKPTRLNKSIQILQFLWKAGILPNFHLMGCAFRFAWRFFFQEGMSYWCQNEISEYLKEEISQMHQGSKSSLLEKVTVLMTKEILVPQDIALEQKYPYESLIRQIQNVYPGSEIVSFSNIQDLLNDVRNRHGLSSSFLLNEESDSLRVSCKGGLFLIALELPQLRELGEKAAIGVLSHHFSLDSHEIVEASLRILGTIYVSNRQSLKLRDERIAHENKLAVASIARQVAHDIRSPLGALSIALKSAIDLPHENRTLIESAADRIRNIADDLLKRNIATKGLPHNNISVGLSVGLKKLEAEAILPVIAEMRSLHAEIDFGVNIQPDVMAIGCKTSFQRVISNIVNNSVESKPSKISVTAMARSDKLVVTIQDNGCGMPEEILEKIRAGESGFSYQKENGNGLGVSSAIEFAKGWQGQFSIHSKLNEGTMVQIVLPLASRDQRQQGRSISAIGGEPSSS